MEFTLSSSSPSVLLFGCNRSLIMKTHQKKQNLIWTTVIAILLMMVLIDNMPIVNSLASSTSNSLLCMSNLVVTQQQYRVNNNNNNNNNNMQRQRRSLTPLSSLSYYATIGSTNSISDEIPPSREILDVSETEEEPMIYSATTSTNILINTWNKIKSSMKFDKKAILGLGFDFGLTYNFISNINGSITLSVAWYIASIKTGLSPLAPGQWRALLAAYASMYVIVCFLRPFRIALALGATHRMERFLQYMQQRIGCTRPSAIFVTGVLGIALWVSCSAIGVTLASTLAGVPVWRTTI